MSQLVIPPQQRKILSEVGNVLLVILGCIMMAFGDALFIAPCNIISGGVSSVGIIVNFFVYNATGFECTDIVVAACQILLWVLGLIVLGKKFSIHTLIAMIVYPATFSLIYRLNLGEVFGMTHIYEASLAGGPEAIGPLLFAATFGGFLCGAGIALAYHGNGSTGGFNIVSAIIARYSEIKENASSLIIDVILIVLGALIRLSVPNNFVLSCIGILCAIVCSLSIRFLYVDASQFVICDIISDKYEEINRYVIDEMDHSTTMFDTVGGYTGEDRKLVRAVIYQEETTKIREFIASVDPKAFVSFTKAKTINGEGFEPFYVRHKKKKLLNDAKKENSQQNLAEVEEKHDGD